jgi:hypothetical protein
MMPNQQHRERLESLQRRKNGSVLQMIQTLEIYSTALKNDDACPLPPSKRSCLTFHRSTDPKSRLSIMPDVITCHDTTDESDYCNDDETFVSTLCNSPSAPTPEADTIAASDKPFEVGIVTPPSGKPPRITTRRQRRANDTSSCYYSDFCNNDLSRQIEAMVFEVETAYENRHVKKPKHSVAQHSSTDCSSIKEVEQASSADNSLEMIKDTASSTPVKNPLQDKTLKTIKDTPSTPNKNPLQLLHRMFETQQEYDAVPTMKACDSLVSLSSEYSISTRSSSDNLSLAPTKKARKISPQPNAEWAIIV